MGFLVLGNIGMLSIPILFKLVLRRKTVTMETVAAGRGKNLSATLCPRMVWSSLIPIAASVMWTMGCGRWGLDVSQQWVDRHSKANLCRTSLFSTINGRASTAFYCGRRPGKTISRPHCMKSVPVFLGGSGRFSEAVVGGLLGISSCHCLNLGGGTRFRKRRLWGVQLQVMADIPSLSCGIGTQGRDRWLLVRLGA